MILRLSLLACVFLALCSCRNDFTLEGDYQDLPVAYAFLDAEDERHFVRVEKAFLQSGGNAETNAGIPDSIFYGSNDATIILENTRSGESTELERVDGRDFDLDRDDGVFATNPNVLYTVRDRDLPLSGGDGIRLTIQRPGQTDAVAITDLIDEIEINRPNELVRVDRYAQNLVMSWSKEDNAAVYDVTIFFNIRELFPNDPSANREIRLEWPVATAFVPGPDQTSERLVRFDVNNEAFYQFIGNSLEPRANVVRRFLSFDLRVSAAGQEVLDRRNLEGANAGLTSSQSLPRYTNLMGGLGLVTSNTSTLREGIMFDNISLDTLQTGIYTSELGFR